MSPGVSARHEGGGLFYHRPEVAATYRVLLLLDYPDDAVPAAALESPYFAGVDAAAEGQRLLQYGKRRGNPLTDRFEREHPGPATALAELRGLVRTATVPQLLGRLSELFGVRGAYLARGDRRAAENPEKLRELARGLVRTEQALTLRQYVGVRRGNILAGVPEPDAGLDGAGTTPPHVRLLTVHAAKGLEFPLVIVPEVQAPLVRPDLDPAFLLTPDGLDVDLWEEAGLETRSANFAAVLAASRPAQLEEEMRVFYVAITRAQHAVAFVVGGPPRNPPLSPEAEGYAWADEIRRAWPALRRLGATAR
jgi:ATP-dependent exoDNAse (exonuclease V) beta subunit